MDNANTITDMAKVTLTMNTYTSIHESNGILLSQIIRLQTQNSVYEIISDMSSRQDSIEERLNSLEDKLQALQVLHIIVLPTFCHNLVIALLLAFFIWVRFSL